MNIQDIAEIAGVSTTTVSRVINHPGLVTLDNKLKVEAIIRLYGFKPNPHAHNLGKRRSGKFERPW